MKFKSIIKKYAVITWLKLKAPRSVQVRFTYNMNKNQQYQSNFVIFRRNMAGFMYRDLIGKYYKGPSSFIKNIYKLLTRNCYVVTASHLDSRTYSRSCLWHCKLSYYYSAGMSPICKWFQLLLIGRCKFFIPNNWIS